MSDAAAEPLIATEDLKECPGCNAPLVSTGRNDRICNTCGLSVRIVTEEDELDAEADRIVRSRGWNEEQGRARKVGKFQTRW